MLSKALNRNTLRSLRYSGVLRCYFSNYPAKPQNNRSKPFGMTSGPGPMRLGDPKDQREMEEAIEKANKSIDEGENMQGKTMMSAEELEQFYEKPTTVAFTASSKDGKRPKEQTYHEDALAAFPNNTNPETGEIGGPRGPEPTRFGDWERKGRVTDF